MKICERCGIKLADNKSFCYCGCAKFVIYDEKNKTYLENNHSYKRLEWYRYAANNLCVNNDNHIDIKVRHPSLLAGLQEIVIKENIKYATKVFYIIPSIIFYALALGGIIVFLVSPSHNLLGNNERIMLLAFSLFFLLMGALITYLHIFKHQKKIYMSTHGQKGYVTLKEQDQMMLQIYFNEMKRLQDSGYFFKPLYSERLGIREFKELDSDKFRLITQEVGFCTYLAMEPMGTIDAQNYINKHINYYKEKKIYRLALVNQHDECIGFIGLSTHNESRESCEIVYGISNHYARQGMMSEAVTLFTHFLISYGKKIIIATHCVDNTRSGQVLLKCGFVRDEHYDEMMMIHGVNTLIIGYHYEPKK